MDELNKIRNRLKEDLDGILQRNEGVLSAIRQKDPAGNLSFEDLGTNGEFDDVLDSLGDLARRELLEVWNAMQRIEQGTYGVCVECGEKIDADRLMAIPSTERCIDCAQKLERQ